MISICVWAQGCLKGKVALWVAAAHPIWQEVDVKAPDAMHQATEQVAAAIDALIARAHQEGFPAAKLPSGLPLKQGALRLGHQSHGFSNEMLSNRQ